VPRSLWTQRVLIYDPDETDGVSGSADGNVYAVRATGARDSGVWMSVGYKQGRTADTALRQGTIAEAVFGCDDRLDVPTGVLLRHLANGRLFKVTSAAPNWMNGELVLVGETGDRAEFTITSDVPRYTVASVVVEPALVVLSAGGTDQLTVEATSTTGDALTNAERGRVTWTVSTTGVVRINADGSLEALTGASGTVEVTATVGGVSGTSTVTVL
jgi:hypothetical protein